MWKTASLFQRKAQKSHLQCYSLSLDFCGEILHVLEVTQLSALSPAVLPLMCRRTVLHTQAAASLTPLCMCICLCTRLCVHLISSYTTPVIRVGTWYTFLKCWTKSSYSRPRDFGSMDNFVRYILSSLKKICLKDKGTLDGKEMRAVFYNQIRRETESGSQMNRTDSSRPSVWQQPCLFLDLLQLVLQ